MARVKDAGGAVNEGSRVVSCPGYGDIFDKAHRDETVKIRNRHSRMSGITSRHGKPPLFDHGHRMFSSLSPDAEFNALNLFFCHYSYCQDAQATCSFFSILPGMYAKSQASSPLAKATTALALLVAHLHYSHGHESTISHSTYAEAVTKAREALIAPAESKSDELLMTTLVLEVYESTNATFGNRKLDASMTRLHVNGSIALLKHRGPLNYRNELSWRLIVAARNRLLQHTWHRTNELASIDTMCDIWERGAGLQPQSPAVHADTLAFMLVRLKLLERMEPKATPPRGQAESPRIDSNRSQKTHFDGIIARAVDLARNCAVWQDNVPPTWRPVPVLLCNIAPSIRAAGIYEQVAPTAHASLFIANLFNRHRITELGCLSFITNCLVRISSQNELQLMPFTLARAQTLVDDICASVPFFAGDVTPGRLDAMEVLIPSATQASPAGNKDCHLLSRSRTEHTHQVLASGLYMMYRTLNAVVELLGGASSNEHIRDAIRPGQVEWMIEQAHRLGDIICVSKKVVIK